MSAVVALRPSRMPAPLPSVWERCPARQRDVAIVKHALARRVNDRMSHGQSQHAAIHHVLAELRMGEAEQALALLESMPSPATLKRWSDALQAGGIEGLVPKHNGRPRKDYGWEARAGLLFAQPQRPCYATVAYWLRSEGFGTATESRVRRYLKSLPSNKAETSPKRLGAHFYDQNVRPHVRRDTSVLRVGEVYEGDGHTCDVYVAHPANGKPFRAELTPWIDVASHYIPGWWLDERESGMTTLYALSTAIRLQDHVPTTVHTDPGSGFDNKMLADQELGFYNRLSIAHSKAIAGNARGKGLIEGWFRWFEERCGKRFETFCGDCRTDDALSRLRQRIGRGELRLPTFAEFYDAVAAYITAYNHTPQESLHGRTPAQVWAELQRNPLHLPMDSLLRPQRAAKVQRWEVRLNNRFYRAAALAQWEGRKVSVEYDVHDESRVWIRDAQGRLIGEAALVGKTAAAKENVLADRRARSLAGQIAREQRAIDEKTEQARLPVHASAFAVREALEVEATALPSPDAGLARLDSGHGFAPVLTHAQANPVREVDSAELASIRHYISESTTPVDETTPEQRFSRALALQRQREAGDALPEADAAWLGTYTRSAECQGLTEVYEAFGTLPGLAS